MFRMRCTSALTVCCNPATSDEEWGRLCEVIDNEGLKARHTEEQRRADR